MLNSSSSSASLSTNYEERQTHEILHSLFFTDSYNCSCHFLKNLSYNHITGCFFFFCLTVTISVFIFVMLATYLLQKGRRSFFRLFLELYSSVVYLLHKTGSTIYIKWSGQTIKSTVQYNALHYTTITCYDLNNKHKVGLSPFQQCQ